MKQINLIGACQQLDDVFSTVEHHLGHLQELTNLLDADLSIIQTAFQTTTSGWSPSIHLLYGALQQELSIVVEHRHRLEQLITELGVRPNSPVVDALLLRFSRLFAAHQDTQWIEQQPNAEFRTERLVRGMLPSKTRHFLSGEAQLMIGKFALGRTSWSQMRERLVAHRYWVDCLLATLPPGHALTHPLVMMHRVVDRCDVLLQQQIQFRAALKELERIQDTAESGLGNGRVFALEQMRLKALLIPFVLVEEGEE